MKYPYIRINIYRGDEITIVIFEDENVGAGCFIDKDGQQLRRYSIVRDHPEAKFKTTREAIGIVKKFFNVEEFTRQEFPNSHNRYYYVKGTKS